MIVPRSPTDDRAVRAAVRPYEQGPPEMRQRADRVVADLDAMEHEAELARIEDEIERSRSIEELLQLLDQVDAATTRWFERNSTPAAPSSLGARPVDVDARIDEAARDATRTLERTVLALPPGLTEARRVAHRAIEHVRGLLRKAMVTVESR